MTRSNKTKMIQEHMLAVILMQTLWICETYIWCSYTDNSRLSDVKDRKQFSPLKMLCCIGLLRWDSAEMVSVMPVIYSVTGCCIISFHSLTLIKGKGLLLPVNLCSTGSFIQNKTLILEKTKKIKKLIKTISLAIQKYPFYTAITGCELIKPWQVLHLQCTINRRNPGLSIAMLQHC